MKCFGRVEKCRSARPVMLPYSQPKMRAPVGGIRSSASFGSQPSAPRSFRGSGYEATARIWGGEVTGVSGCLVANHPGG